MMIDSSDRLDSPITTYSGQGTTKKGVDQSEHTIVFSGERPPVKLPGEVHMKKEPLHIDVESPHYKLDPKLRINLSKRIPISHNVKVQSLGQMTEPALTTLLRYVESYAREDGAIWVDFCKTSSEV